MEEDFLIDEFSLTPPEEKTDKKEKGVVEVPKAKEQSTLKTVLLGPDVPMSGTMLQESAKGISKIVDIMQGKEPEGDVSLPESVTGATISASIKIPKGLVNFGTLLYDALQESGIPVEESATQKFNNWFESTYLGQIEKASQEVARETATGRFTEAIGQLYGGGKIAQKVTVPLVTNLATKSRQLVNAIKGNRYARTAGNPNAIKAAEKAAKLNQVSGTDKFIGVAVGGGIGTGAVVMKVEDLGTFGDIDALDFLPTTLDRKQREEAGEDAQRQLLNKFKFGAEVGFPIIPFVYGVGKSGYLLATQGKELAFSNNLMKRWLDRFVGQPFRSRSNKAQEIFDGVQKLEGKKASISKLAEDAALNFDDRIREISKTTSKAAEALENPNTLSSMVSDFMLSTDDVVKANKIVFNGFGEKAINNFKKSLNKIGVNNKSINNIIDDAVSFRQTAAGLKNLITAGKNINVATSELNTILNERIKNVLGVSYKMIDLNKGLINGYKPTLEAKESVAKIFQRYARNNGKSLDPDSAMTLVNNMTKSMRIDPVTKTPSFPIGTQSALDDSAVFIKNIGENITAGGKFKPDKAGGLIQTKSDLEAFNNLFGSYKDAKTSIYNVMNELGEMVGRDKFYTELLQGSNNIKQALKNGATNAQVGRPIFYKNYNDAVLGLPNQKIIQTPLKLKAGALPETIYSSPIDGMFTSETWADAIKNGDKLIRSPLTRSVWYRGLMLIPKSLTQAGKTILGPFTHSRNFFSSLITTVHRGNIFISPTKLWEFANTARKTVQPQILYKLTGNPKYRNVPEGQALYRFLLEEGVVNQNLVSRELEGLFDDLTRAKGANETADVWFAKTINSVSKPFRKIFDVSQELYTAEDDIFRAINFLAEGHKLNQAFRSALDKGLIKKMPSQLEIMKEAAQIVRETVPNYAYVSDFVKAVRRSPLGSFAAFPAEIYRTATNTLARGLYEAKDPIRQSIGYRSLAGQALTYATLPVVAVESFKGLYGISREKLAALREVLPTWSEDNTILPIYEDGKYKYIDFSHGFFYDTLINPAQTALATAEREGLDNPLFPTFVQGVVKSMGKMMEPFVNESIWFGVVADLFIRGGRDAEGRRVWNDRDSWGDKVNKAFQYATYKLSPGSYPQLKRLYAAATNQTIKGTQYEIPDELLGLVGFRKTPIDLKKTLDFKITEFKDIERDERALIYNGTFTGDPIDDENKIIRQFIFANKQRLETFNKMRRFYDAVKVLGMRDDVIAEEFADRKVKSLYGFIENNEFKPFKVGRDIIQAYAKKAEEQGIKSPLNDRVLDRLNAITERLYDSQKLNKEFIIDEEKYLLKPEAALRVPPLPQQPQPNPQIVQTPMQTGLTPAESSLLSNEEKMIRLRQRGLA
jgi:hypothetical protein